VKRHAKTVEMAEMSNLELRPKATEVEGDATSTDSPEAREPPLA